MNKVFTVRLSDDQVANLSTLATFDGVAIAEEIREAITMLLKKRSEDPNFARRVRDAYENAGRVLAGLERGNEVISALGNPFEAPATHATHEPLREAKASLDTRTSTVSAGRVRSRA